MFKVHAASLNKEATRGAAIASCDAITAATTAACDLITAATTAAKNATTAACDVITTAAYDMAFKDGEIQEQRLAQFAPQPRRLLQYQK